MVCACDPSVYLNFPSIGFVCVCLCLKLSLHLGVWELDHMCLFSPCCSLCDFTYYVVEVQPVIVMHLTLWYIVIVFQQNDVCVNYNGRMYVGGYYGLSKSGLCVFGKSCPVSFIVSIYSHIVC